MGRGVRIHVLCRHSPTSLLKPVIRNSRSQALLLAVKTLARKTGDKIFMSNNKTLLNKFFSVVEEGVGSDWDQLPIHYALQSNQELRLAIRDWGTSRWQTRWSHLTTCKQTKVWLPRIRGSIIPFIRRLDRKELGHLIHFITGHNHLLRHRSKLGQGGDDKCRLCGVVREDPVHLWVECSATRNLGGEGGSTRSPNTWSLSQLCRFLREPTIAGLLDQVGIEQTQGVSR